jgi:hypothetical protein
MKRALYWNVVEYGIPCLIVLLVFFGVACYVSAYKSVILNRSNPHASTSYSQLTR